MSLTAELLAPKTPYEAHRDAGVNLDPTDWAALRRQAHCMLEDILDYVETIRDRPVWQPMPAPVRAAFRTPVPRLPTDLSAVHQEFLRNVLPYAGGNVHPGFMGWVQGGGTPVGIVAEMLAAGLNANLGGRDHAPVEVERQIVQWMREIFGFPATATGLFVTGTSVANFLAAVIARDVAAGFAVRRGGIAAAGGQLRAYASVTVHGCVARAFDLCGLGSDSLRLIPDDTHHRLDIQVLQQAVESDRAAGFLPFMAIGTAGTVDTGAIDDLSAIGSFCRREKLWFHVDGAFGALAMLAPDLAPRLSGIECADSLAFDFHKWGQVPYDAGFLLVRDGVLHRNAFASAAAYLSRNERGLAAGAPWLCDFGPDLSRGFRALKTWMTLKVFGTDAVGAAISHTCAVARHLECRIARTPELELLAPVELNIVCFRYRAEDADPLNAKLVVQLHESGITAPSVTVIDGRTAIRAAVVNHRTTCADADALIDAVLALGRAARPRRTAPAPQQHCPSTASRPLQDRLCEVDALLTQQPRCVPTLFRRGLLLFQTGANEEAEKAWLEVLSIEPDHLGALNSLGDLLFAAGKFSAAREMYCAAVAKHPGDAASRVNLANLLIRGRQLESAREQLDSALRIDPQYRPAHAGLSFVLADLGEPESAAHHRQIAFENRCVIPAPYRGRLPPIEILELLSTSGGNVRMRAFLSDRIFKKYLVAAQFYDVRTPLPPHRLVINSIGDVETGAEALPGAQRLVEHTHAPVINAPSAVLRTGRAEVARRLGQIPGVIAPGIVRFPRAALATPKEAVETLAAAGLRFPLLFRAPGFHGGEHFVRLETAAELPTALCELPGAELDAIEYLDARAADGKTRKYRVMMIDGRLYPLHAAVARSWKIHYFSAEMEDHPEHRAEEAEFLESMAETLGQRAMTALAEIQRVLGLDYGGIDFSLDAHGNILLFEANATMAILPPHPDARWDYRRPAFEQACLAVHRMLLARAMDTAPIVPAGEAANPRHAAS